MRVRWLVFVISLGVLFTANASNSQYTQYKLSQRKYELQPAPSFLFVERLFRSPCIDRPSTQPMRPGTSVMAITPQASYLRTRLERLTFSRTDVPALTVASDLGAVIKIAGEERNDWSLRFCAEGEGDSEAEALGRMQDVSLTRMGGTVSMGGHGSDVMARGRADLTVYAPEDAPTTVHSSFASVEVHDMTGPVRISASHARTVILNTTGRVDAAGEIVDFAGAKGTLMLNATAEIDLKLTATRFQGSLSAFAGRSVRVLVPRGFQTPFEAVVGRRKDFVCRTDFCSRMKEEKRDGLYVFTFPGDGSDSTVRISLRSEHATVVIDTTDRVCGMWCDQ